MDVIICDDEQEQIDAVKVLITGCARKLKINVKIREFTRPQTMLFETEDPDTWPDIVCMDVNMPKMTGIEAAEKLRERGQNCPILFFSILQDVQMLLRAFDVRATNYFIKDQLADEVPRFERTFRAIARQLDDNDQEAVVFSCGGESRNILVKDIYYFEVNRRIITVHYKQGNFEFYSQLGKIENMLDGRNFIRTHRAFLVASSCIASISSKDVALYNGDILPLSRSYAADVKAALANERVEG